MERTYTINVRRGTILAPRTRRAKRAMMEIKRYLVKHMKTEEIKVSEQLNELVWSHGMRNPIMRVKVVVTKDKDNIAHARLFGEPAPVVKEAKVEKAPTTPKKKVVVKKAEPAEEKASETVVDAKVEAPKAAEESSEPKKSE